MLSKQDIISLFSGLLGAVLGTTIAGPAGAILGAVLSWLILIIFAKNTKNQRLKRRIVKTLDKTNVKQVRDIMATHNISVPTNCFNYDDDHFYVKKLAEYRQAFISLESEGLITQSSRYSVSHGYVNPPNDWVNDWSGRAYIKTASGH
jgi:hypothetical protein